MFSALFVFVALVAGVAVCCIYDEVTIENHCCCAIALWLNNSSKHIELLSELILIICSAATEKSFNGIEAGREKICASSVLSQ